MKTVIEIKLFVEDGQFVAQVIYKDGMWVNNYFSTKEKAALFAAEYFSENISE